jgi:hypothetical protein
MSGMRSSVRISDAYRYSGCEARFGKVLTVKDSSSEDEDTFAVKRSLQTKTTTLESFLKNGFEGRTTYR